MVDDTLISFSLHTPVILLVHHHCLPVDQPTHFYTLSPYYVMAPKQCLLSRGGGFTGASSSWYHHLFGWHSMAYHFDFVAPKVRNEILQLEAKEFVDQRYFSNSEINDNTFKWTPYPRKFCQRTLHFLHWVVVHRQLEILLHMVIHDKQVDNYKLFEIKWILWDVRYNLDDIVAS